MTVEEQAYEAYLTNLATQEAARVETIRRDLRENPPSDALDHVRRLMATAINTYLVYDTEYNISSESAMDLALDFMVSENYWGGLPEDAPLRSVSEALKERAQLRASLQELYDAHKRYKSDTDEPPPYRHRTMMEQAAAILGN